MPKRRYLTIKLRCANILENRSSQVINLMDAIPLCDIIKAYNRYLSQYTTIIV